MASRHASGDGTTPYRNLDVRTTGAGADHDYSDDHWCLLKHAVHVATLATVLAAAWTAGRLGIPAFWLVAVVAGLLVAGTTCTMGSSRQAVNVMSRLLSEIIQVFNCRTLLTSEVRAMAQPRHLTSSFELQSDVLPAWVKFPDFERVEWLNTIIACFWPHINCYVKKKVRPQVEFRINELLPAILKPFSFRFFTLGLAPARLGGIKVLTNNVRRDEILMDCDLMIHTRLEVVVSAAGLKAGVANLQIGGQLRIAARLVDCLPIIGNVEISFLEPPKLDFDLVGVVAALNVFPLSQILRYFAQRQLCRFVVLPKKLPVQLAKRLSDIRESLTHTPLGVLRLVIIEAKELHKSGVSLFGRNHSHQYCKISVETEVFRTTTTTNTAKPTWNHLIEVIIHRVVRQSVVIEVMDVDGDKEIGSTVIDLKDVRRVEYIDKWLKLVGVKTGSIHVCAWWMSLSNDVERLLLQSLKPVDARSEDDDGINEMAPSSDDNSTQLLSTAILIVTIDSAKSLPTLSRKTSAEPSPWASLRVGRCERKTSTKKDTNNPKWNETFEFLVHSVHVDSLEIKIMDAVTHSSGSVMSTVVDKQCLGHLRLRLDQLIQTQLSATSQSKAVIGNSQKPLTAAAAAAGIHQPFALSDSGFDSTLTLQIRLVALKTGGQADHSEVGPVSDRVKSLQADADDSSQQADGSPSGTTPTTAPPGECNVNDDNDGSNRNLSSYSLHSGLELVGDGRVEEQRRLSDSVMIELSVQYIAEQSQLTLYIHRCTGLPDKVRGNVRLGGINVRATLYNERPLNDRSRQKTKTVKTVVDPEFNERMTWVMAPVELASGVVKVDLRGTSTVSSLRHLALRRIPLGSTCIVLLEVCNSAEPVKNWYEVQTSTRILRGRSAMSLA